METGTGVRLIVKEPTGKDNTLALEAAFLERRPVISMPAALTTIRLK